MVECIYGWSEAEALTMNINSLIPKDQEEEELAKLKKLIHAEVLEPYRTKRLAKYCRVVEVWLINNISYR